MPKPTLENEWASNVTLTAGPYAGVRPTKVTPSAGQIADGIVSGASFKGQFVNWITNHLWSWASWLNDGSSADGADAHVVETNGDGEINVVGVVVGGVDLADALGVYGDGSDGDVTINASTTSLGRSFYYDNLTLTSAGILDANGHVVHVRGTLTVDATSVIHWDGGAGAAGAGSVGGAAGTSGLSGAPLGAGYAGGAGGSTAAPGDPGTAGGDAIQATLGGDGGAGGGAGQAGGNASATTAASAADGALRGIMAATTGHTLGAGAITQVRGGGGGGGGGSGTGLNAGGGGGCGGNVGVICARRIVLAGEIRAAGGAGGAGESNAGGTGGGGGGGGSGGVLYVVTRGIDNPENCVATGGVGGAGGTGAGNDGNDGNDGSDGVVVLVYA
jgi:hypothetical protein